LGASFQETGHRFISRSNHFFAPHDFPKEYSATDNYSQTGSDVADKKRAAQIKEPPG
jgi:hypothetical protein